MPNEKGVELWDIYDSEKRPTGRTMKRGDFTLKDDEFHLTVLAVLRTADGKALITKRAQDKRWAPGHWEIPGGGSQAGESSYAAVCREVFEETNIKLTGKDGILLHTYSRTNPGEGDNYFVDVYGFEISEADIEGIRIQEEEMTEYRLADVKEIESIAGRKEFLHFCSIKDVLYGYLKSQGCRLKNIAQSPETK